MQRHAAYADSAYRLLLTWRTAGKAPALRTPSYIRCSPSAASNSPANASFQRRSFASVARSSGVVSVNALPDFSSRSSIRAFRRHKLIEPSESDATGAGYARRRKPFRCVKAVVPRAAHLPSRPAWKARRSILRYSTPKGCSGGHGRPPRPKPGPRARASHTDAGASSSGTAAAPTATQAPGRPP